MDECGCDRRGEAIRKWWKRNWRCIVVGIIIGVVVGTSVISILKN